MKFREIVTGLNLSKKLKKVGISQTGIYYHVQNIEYGLIRTAKQNELSDTTFGKCRVLCRAFTSSELIEELPKEIEYRSLDAGHLQETKLQFMIGHTPKGLLHASYIKCSGAIKYTEVNANLPKALGRLYLDLKRRGLI